MLVNDDFGPLARGPETRVDEVHLGFHNSEVILRAALQDEARTEIGQVRDAGDIEENVLREDRGEPGKDLLGAPALALEVDDVGLHEDSAAVAEYRHRLSPEGLVGELLDGNPNIFRCRLEEVAVPGRTLRVQLEVFDAAVLQDDQFDVLAADVHDDMRIVVEPMADSVWATVSTSATSAMSTSLSMSLA